MRKTVTGLIILAAILFVGTTGYMVLEGSSMLNALYMTVITITTVGYGEVFPLSPSGKLFTIALIVVGVSFVLYLFGNITEAMVEGGLRRILGRKKMEKKVSRLKDHYIVCGFGRIGKVICSVLKENNRPFAVIEHDPEQIQQIEELGYLSLQGEASNDEMLLAAGIKKAKGLIAVVSSDADNVYITLSAKGLNPNLFILARSSGEEGSEVKLLRAGANKVISPYYIGACRMAHLLVRPTVIDFIDLTVHAGELGLRLEEMRVTDKAAFAGKSLKDTNIRKEHDLIVVAIKRDQGEMLFNPGPDTTILQDDILVVLGEHDHIKAFEKLL
ncbi:MAG: potassium channel protein [Desulfobacterales bacterium]|nr:potassium channel protein [Desulfobacterales bacterium]